MAQPRSAKQKWNHRDGRHAGQIVFTFVVRNTGNVPLTQVTVDDLTFGQLDLPCVDLLPVGAEAVCQTGIEYVLTKADVKAGGFVNVATAEAVNGQGVVDSDEASVNIPVKANAVPPPPNTGALPNTGSSVSPLQLWLASLSTGLGAFLLALGRRRRRRES